MQPAPSLGSGQGASDSMAQWGVLADAIIRADNKQAQYAPITSTASNTFSTKHIDTPHGIIIHPQTQPLSLHTIIQSIKQV
jgi:hypothetical protein